MMMNVLITGATGNIGTKVLKALSQMDHPLNIFAGVIDIGLYNKKPGPFKAKPILFDFTNTETF